MLLEDCFSLAIEVKDSIELKNTDYSKIICSLLYFKIIDTTRGVTFLIEKHLLAESYVLIRHLMETFFILKAGCKNDDILKNYVGRDEYYRMKQCNIILNNIGKISPEKRIAVENELEKIKSNIIENKIEEMDFEKLANKAGVGNIYEIYYRNLCNIAHSSIRSLDKYVVFNDAEQVKRVHDKPYRNELTKQLHLVNLLLFISIECMVNKFSLGARFDLCKSVLDERLAKLCSKIRGDDSI